MSGLILSWNQKNQISFSTFLAATKKLMAPTSCSPNWKCSLGLNRSAQTQISSYNGLVYQSCFKLENKGKLATFKFSVRNRNTFALQCQLEFVTGFYRKGFIRRNVSFVFIQSCWLFEEESARKTCKLALSQWPFLLQRKLNSIFVFLTFLSFSVLCYNFLFLLDSWAFSTEFSKKLTVFVSEK